MIVRPEESLHEVQHVIVKPFGMVHDMLGNDAVWITGIDALAEDRKEIGLVRRGEIRAADAKPPQGAQDRPATLALIAGRSPNLAQHAETSVRWGCHDSILKDLHRHRENQTPKGSAQATMEMIERRLRAGGVS
jgi:hypothetical protein